MGNPEEDDSVVWMFQRFGEPEGANEIRSL